ncbi:MAG: hypothetical protein NT169_23930 [Chloroflexi bacterium]|nr:hypothetical protein [Chloroflexota bacterium]
MMNSFGAALRRLARGQLTLDDLWLLLPPLALLIILDLYLIRPYDFWWHLRTGQLIVQTGAVPTVDLFTYTRAGMPWTNQSWLTQVVFYLLYRAGNLPLVIFWHALTIAAGYVLIELACLINSRGQTRPAAIAAAAALSVFNWNIRPQTTSFLLFGLLVFILETHRTRRTRLIWLTPAVFAVWVNVHGGFVFGLGLLGLYVAAEVSQEWRAHRKPERETARLAAVLVLSILALSINPAGPLGMIQYVVGFLSSGATQNNNLEFQPLSIRTVDGVIFVAVTAIFLLIVYLRRLPLPPYQVAALLGFGLWSLYSRRVEPWFGMAVAPAFALALTPKQAAEPLARASRPNKPRLNYLVLGLLALLVCGSLPWLRPSLPLPADRRTWVFAKETPVRATEVLCQLGDTVRVFSDMGYSSYISWACPSTPVFMDTRFELYPAQMWKEYLSVSTGRYDWETILAKYGVNLVFANKVEEPTLIAAIKASADWQNIYEDADSVIFQKRNP